jgi:hypothetical protein
MIGITMATSTLTRLRADPMRVRVGVRRCGVDWIVNIASRLERDAHPVAEVIDPSPRKALVLALRMAEACRLPGIDIDMSWAYEHPQGAKAADRARWRRMRDSL